MPNQLSSSCAKRGASQLAPIIPRPTKRKTDVYVNRDTLPSFFPERNSHKQLSLIYIISLYLLKSMPQF